MKTTKADGRERLAAAMAKLGRFDDDERMACTGPLLGATSPTREKKSESWKTQLVSCGSNAFGQAYFQDIMSSNFKAIKFDSSVVVEDVACGSTISAARLNSGDLYVWGTGLPSGPLKAPTLIPIKNVIKVSCGQGHIGIITSNGRVLTWGNNDNGQL